MTEKTKDLNQIIEDEKKNFHKDTFKVILKEWGVGFAKLPQNEKLETMKEVLKLAGISLADSPAGGLAIKIAEGRRRDSDTQERIRFAQAYNLAVSLVGSLSQKDSFSADSVDKYKIEIEFWQKYFYQKLGEGDQNNN